MNKNNSYKVWLVVAVITIVLVVIGKFIYLKDNKEASVEEQIVLENQNEIQMDTDQELEFETKEVSTVIKEGLSSWSPENEKTEEWTTVNNEILNFTKKQNDYLQSFSFPPHPTKENVVYFSTATEYNEDLTQNFNKIYMLDLNSKEVTEIYTEVQPIKTLKFYEDPTVTESEVTTEMGFALKTIGIDGTKLILLKQLIDDSPGPCTSIWIGVQDEEYHYGLEWLYLDVENIADGLKPYTVPDYKVAQEQEKQQECMMREFGVTER